MGKERDGNGRVRVWIGGRNGRDGKEELKGWEERERETEMEGGFDG